VRIVTSATWKR